MRRLTGLRAAFLNYMAPEPVSDSECVGKACDRAVKSDVGQRGCGRERAEYTAEEDEVYHVQISSKIEYLNKCDKILA